MSGRWRVLLGILLLAALWLIWSRLPSGDRLSARDPGEARVSESIDPAHPGGRASPANTSEGPDLDRSVPGEGHSIDWRARVRQLRNSPPPELFGLQGRVVSGDEEDPARDVELTLYARRNPVTHVFQDIRAKARSAADGGFVVALEEPFQGWVTVRKEGFARLDEALYLLAPGTESRTFKLTPAVASLSGRVLQAIEEIPVEGATVTVSFPRSEEDSPGFSTLVSRSDASGAYRIEGIPPGRIDVEARLPGCFESTRSFTVEGGEYVEDLRVIRADEAVSITVRNRAGESLSEAFVERPDGMTVQADETGRVMLPLISELSSLHLKVWAPGYIGRQLELEIPPASDVVVLEKGPRFGGRVVSESGQAIPGARVQIYTKRALRSELEQSATTDEKGRFEVGLSRPPLTALQVTRRGFVGTQMSYSAGQAPSSVELVLRPAETALQGRVVDPEGKPVENFHLELRPSQPGHYTYSRRFRGTTGEFFVEELPAGLYHLIASAVPEGLEYDVLRFRFLSRSIQGVELRPGEVTSLQVKLVAEEFKRHPPKGVIPTPTPRR